MTGLILRIAFLLLMIAAFIGIGAFDAGRERRRAGASGAASSPDTGASRSPATWAAGGDTSHISRAQPDPPAAIRRAA